MKIGVGNDSWASAVITPPETPKIPIALPTLADF